MGLFNRKKKEAEEAKKAAELAESKAKAEAARAKRAKELAEKEAAAEKAEKAAAEKEAKEKKDKLLASQKKAEDLKAKRAAEAEAKKKAIEEATVKHVWTNEDTYAKLAFKYYGSIKKPFYMLIYEHNKAIIGDNMNSIKTGTEIEIPPLPKELEDQK